MGGKSRLYRNIFAIALCLGLTSFMFWHSRNLTLAEQRLGKSIVSNYWKFSELIYETERFGSSVLDLKAGESDLATVRVQFDVLWSRLSVISNLDLRAQPKLKSLLETLKSDMAEFDSVIYSDASPTALSLDHMRQFLRVRAKQLRQVWIEEFNETRFENLSTAAADMTLQRRQLDIALLIFVSGIMTYLLFEMYIASKEQARERKLARAANAASKAKSDFIASVSHEIRTPLNGILGMADALRDSPLNSEQEHYLDVLSEAGGVLLATINDVLDISSVEAGNINIEMRPFDIGRTLSLVRTLYLDTARAKNLELRLLCDKNMPDQLMGDQRRLRQVLHNLVANAIKFTEAGSVTVDARFDITDTSGEATSHLNVSVIDTGPGIPEDAQERIFAPFGQADSSITRKHGGTGLGLTISRDICEAMGGTLTVHSTVGQGARFDMSLPLESIDPKEIAEDSRKAPEQVIKEQWTGLRVLIVDDSATNRLVLRKLLKDVNLNIEDADSGMAALKQAPVFRPDLILMDIQMPEMDGVETVHRLLDHYDSVDERPPVISAVTANVLPHQIKSYREAGMDDVLRKPINRHVLFGILDHAANRRADHTGSSERKIA